VRRTLAWALSLTFAAFLVVSMALPGAAQAYSTYTAPEQEFLGLINQYRQANGLGTLRISDAVSDAAEKHSKDMGTYAFFDHTTKNSDYFPVNSLPWDRMAISGYGYSTSKGENIAAGIEYVTAAAVFASWKASPGHNANMLNAGFKVIGISRDTVPGSPYYMYWTTDFGGFVDPSAHDPFVSGAASGPFPDVAASHPYAEAIRHLSDGGIITGYSDGSFGPERPVWRQHFAKMIVKVLGLPVSEADVAPFADVESGGPETLYPDNYIAVAAAQGITQGTGPSSFAPTADIWRAQVVTMVVRAVEKLRPGTLQAPAAGFVSSWADDLLSPHAEAARLAEANGLLDGLPVTALDPWEPMPRGEVAQVLFNLEALPER